MAQLARYERTDENEDLEESISLTVEAILSSDPQIGHDSDVVMAFFYLAESLRHRSLQLKRHDDGKHCVRYLRYLRDQPLETTLLTRGHITTAFARALANQVQMGSIDQTRNIEEMAILCCELLSLDASDELLLGAAETLVRAIDNEAVSVAQPPPDQAIECLREANIRFPNSDIVYLGLLSSLYRRFMVSPSHAAYEDAMSIVGKSFTHPGLVKLASSAAVGLAKSRFYLYGNPEYLEEAIIRVRAHLRTMPSEDPERQEMTRTLEELEMARFDEFSVASNSRAADASNTQVNNRPSPLHLATPPPITRSEMDELTPVTQDVEELDVVKTLYRIIHQPINRATIEEARECRRRYLESSPSSGFLTLTINVRLAELLLRAFHCTDDIAYLNESITLLRNILKSPALVPTRLKPIKQLISAMLSRFLRFRETVDFEEIMQLFSLAAADSCTKAPDRLRISCQWAKWARYYRHPSTSTAYESAISLIKNSLAFSPTLEIQHDRLVSSRGDYETLPLNYASHQIHIGQLEQAVETLEQGRGLLWSEMRGLRMSIHQLRLVNLPLAKRFSAINNDLEALTTSSSAGIWQNEGQVDNDELMDPFGRLVIKQRALVAERDTLIFQIQSLPGFETFLTTPSFDTLRSAAEYGPVIIINHT